MADAFAETDAEQTSIEQPAEEQTSEQQPAQQEQQPAQETAQEQPIQEQTTEEQPQETAQEQPIQEQTTEEQETTEQEPIQPTQQQVEPTQQETIQEQTEQTEPIQQQVESSYIEKQWSENDDVEEMKQRLEYLSKATEIGSKEEKEIFPEYEQLEADKKALLEKYNGRVPKEKQDELAIKYKDFLDRIVKLFNEISSLRIAIEEAEEKTSIKAKEQAKQEKLNNIQNSYNGYLKGLSNLVASRLYKALSNKVNISGEVKTIAEFIEEWQEYFLKLGITKVSIQHKGDMRVWNKCGVNQIAKILKHLYSNSNIYLDRKFERANEIFAVLGES